MIKEIEKLIPHRELLSQQMGVRWFALTGDRIELGDSGIAIVLTNSSLYPPFALVDSVGRHLAYASDLATLKKAAEQHAEQLKEFKP